MSDTDRKRARGMGRTYQRGGIWWIDYSYLGKKHRESTGSTKPSDATKLLKKRLGEIGRGRLIGPAEEKITLDSLLTDFETHRALSGRKAEKNAKQRTAHLRAFFGEARALDITTDRIRAFQAVRLSAKATPATVNRDCAALSKAFSLAVQGERLSRKPYIPHLEEAQPRRGFFEHADYLAVRAKLPAPHQDVLDFMYAAGWRVSEVLALEWGDVDLEGSVIRLRPELSKNGRGRVLALTGELAEVIARRKAARVLTTPAVFHFRNKAIRCWRKRWRTACTNAGMTGMLRHDLRRTAVRNLTRAGVPERVAMGVTGHQTRSVFDRYDIVSEDDLRQAMARRDAYVQTLPTDTSVRTLDVASAPASVQKKRGRK